MHVVIDTTETFNDLLLSGPNFALLSTYLRGSSSRFTVPKIVVEETVNHYRERITRQIQQAESQLKTLRHLVPSLSDFPQVTCNIELATDEYRSRLESRIRNLHGRIADFNSVSTKTLVERALKRRKPFDGEGKVGFRDAILWETVLCEIVVKSCDTQVALITKNSKDFGADGQLAQDLREDCKSIGGSHDRVILFSGLQEFIDKEVKPHLDKLEDIHRQIEEGGYQNFDPADFLATFEDIIVQKIRDYVRRYDLSRLTRSDFYHSPDLESLTEGPGISVDEVWNLDDEQMAVGITFTIKGRIACMQEQDVYYPEGDEVYAHDEPFVGDAVFTGSTTIVLQQSNGDIYDYEVNDVTLTLGRGWMTCY